jgi:ankyrin repeat protein
MSDTLKQKIIDSINDNDFETLDAFLDNNNVSIVACILKIMIQKNIEGLKHLVEEKDGINIKYDNINILTLACQFDWVEAVQFLCQFDSLTNDITQQSEYLLNPLFSCVIYEKIELIQYLLNNEKNLIKDIIPTTKDTILHIAISVDNKTILETILSSLDMDNKHIVDCKNAKGWTPLHLAVFANQLDSVKILVDNGADFNIMDKTSKTPLEISHNEGYDDIFNYLLEKSGSDHFENISIN